jgi:hypothetical protein
MSELTDALEATFSALQASFPEQAKSFLPGLPKEKIRKTIGSLGLPCPDELVDLYHWRNGSKVLLRPFSQISTRLAIPS